MCTRWPNQPVGVPKGTVLVVVLLWLNSWTGEIAFYGLATLALIWYLAATFADAVDRRNARRDAGEGS